MDDRTNSGDPGTASEPSLTQKNSATVKGEESLAAIPSSYGSHGGTAPQADEGSGENGSEE